MRTAALLLSLASSHAAPCSCTGAPASASAWQKCAAKGDPHYRTFAGTKFDFMGRGVYRHLQAPLAACGCDIEVQTFLAASTQHIGASSIVALAVKIGDATLIFDASLRLTVSGSDNDQTLAHPDNAGGGVSFGEQLVATKVSIKSRGKERLGWQLSIPGGGEIIAISYAKPYGMPTGALLSVWVSVPQAVVSASSGHCKQACSGLPPLPNTQCGDDDCLPVFTEKSLFPTSFLTSLEALVPMPSSTRTSFASCGGTSDPCLVCDAERNCVDICGWTDPYPSPPPPPAEVEETCGFPSFWTSVDRICGGDSDQPYNWIINDVVPASEQCTLCAQQGEYDVEGSYNSNRQTAYLAAVQRCAEIPECSQVIGKRITGSNPRKWGYILQGCKDFPVTGDCSAHYDATHALCDKWNCRSWCVYNRGEVTDGTCAEGTTGGGGAPAPSLPSPPPPPGTRPVPTCTSSGWQSGYVVRTAPRPPRRILAPHAVLVSPDLASLTCACRCALSRAQWASASGTMTVWGPAGSQTRTDCPSWCEAQVVESCELRNALKSGYERDSLVKIRWPRRRHMAPPSPLSRSGPPSELWRGAQANAPLPGLPAEHKATAFDPPGWVAPSARHSRAPLASAPPSPANPFNANR